MTKLIAMATLLFSVIFLSPNVVMGETMDDLVEREGLYYKKFSDTPFTGKVTGVYQGNFKNGKEDGAWVVLMLPQVNHVECSRNCKIAVVECGQCKLVTAAIRKC